MSGRQYPELGPLKAGDTVALMTTSSAVTRELVERARYVLESWGLNVRFMPHLFDEHPRANYLGGPEAARAADLQSAWCDPTVDAVLSVRGGYGSIRMLDLLDIDALKAARPKPLLGSSDVTAVLELWGEELGLATWFTPMVATEDFLMDTIAAMGVREALFEPWQGRVLSSETAVPLVRGEASGRLVGGNLAMVSRTLGAVSRAPINNTGAIILLEDVTESVERIDTMFCQLSRAGYFEGAAGVALGSWVECGELEPIRELAVETFGGLGIPVVWELGFGHCERALSIPLGVQATLIADDKPRLVLGE